MTHSDHDILIVDDEPDITETLSQALLLEGYNVKSASSGEMALEMAMTSPFDLVVTDFKMPRMNGIELMCHLKEMDPDIEVIILTAYASIEKVIAAMKGDGAYDFLPKPLENVEELFLTVNRALEKKRLNQEKNALVKHLEALNSDLENQVKLRSEELFKARVDIKRNLDVHNTISSILKLASTNLELKEILAMALDYLFSVSWLSIKSTGAVYLYDKDLDALRLYVKRDFSEPSHITCFEIIEGQCLCGMAALKKEIIFAENMNDFPTLRRSETLDHGHCCVPILNNDELLGVICLDLYLGHIKNPYEEKFMMTFSDALAVIIERKKALKELLYISNYDVLTGLPLKALFLDRLSQSILQARRINKKVAVVCVSLDDYKAINEHLGHDAEDAVFCKTAELLTDSVRVTDTVSRIGGSEFALILNNIKKKNDVKKLLTKIESSFKSTQLINNHPCKLTTSMGVSIFPKDEAKNSKVLWKKADSAMYQARLNGGNSVTFYDHTMHKRFKEKRMLEKDLYNALENEEFLLYYQPQVDLLTGQVTGVEALLRWNHAVSGLIYPDKFIPLAESSGLIIPMGEWVLRSACCQLKQWRDNGINIIMAVNISLIQFQQTDFVERVQRILDEVGVPPNQIELELTESVAMPTYREHTTEILTRLANMGIQMAIDDFGTGYSSLSYLKNLPFSRLKIDRSFVNEINTNESDRSIVKTIVNMAHNLNMNVIAEGVETANHIKQLRELHCTSGQGYFFSKPASAETVSVSNIYRVA